MGGRPVLLTNPLHLFQHTSPLSIREQRDPKQDLNPGRLALQPDTVSFSGIPLSPPPSPISAHSPTSPAPWAPHSLLPHLGLRPHASSPPLPLRRRPLLLVVLGAQMRDTWSNSSRPAAWASLRAGPYRGVHHIISFQRIRREPVPGRQQKVKTQLTPIRALSQAPREVMKYGSGEICNALLSGLSYNGVHANYACRLPPAPGRRTTQRAPGPRPGRWGGGVRGERGGLGKRLGRRGGQ